MAKNKITQMYGKVLPWRERSFHIEKRVQFDVLVLSGHTYVRSLHVAWP